MFFMQLKRLHILFFVLLIQFVLGQDQLTFAQTANTNVLVERIRVNLKQGNAKDFVSDCYDMVEITYPNKESADYNKTQAELTLREFIKKYPATEFKYIHKVLDREDYKFLVGEYLYNGGKFRVSMVLKVFKGSLQIDSIVFE
jgi:hypothetical protein